MYLSLTCDLLVQQTVLNPCAGRPDSSLSHHTEAHPETGGALRQGWTLEETDSSVKNCEKKTVTAKHLRQLYLNLMSTYI